MTHMKWDINRGIVIAQLIESIVVKLGYHVALTGSVLIKGESDKDLDVMIYPHKTTSCSPREEVMEKMSQSGFGEFIHAKHTTYGDDKVVFITDFAGQRVDVFFVQ